MHCQITKTNENELLLEDTNSKFGSLVYLQIKKLKIFPFVILPIQIGRTFLQFSLGYSFSICNCLKYFNNKKKDIYNDDYIKNNSEQITLENILIVKIQNEYDESDENSMNEEQKKNKNLPLEIIIDDIEQKNMLTNSMEKQIEVINTLNLASSDAISKKKTPRLI